VVSNIPKAYVALGFKGQEDCRTLEVEGTVFVLSDRSHPPDTVSHPRRHKSSVTLLKT
jgi:hypothetical protein